MSFVVVWGWLCAVVGTAMALPQLVRLMRSGSSAGLSLLTWQLMLSATLSWTLHGVKIAASNMWLPNALFGLATIAILRLVQKDRGLSFTATFGPGLALGAALATTDWLLGSFVFGLAALAPQLVGALGQLKEIMTAADLGGVSVGYLALSFLVPAMWQLWGLLAHDSAIRVSTAVMGSVALVNLVWVLLRRTGVLTPVTLPSLRTLHA